jgi:SAM-dependent methyltransferase
MARALLDAGGIKQLRAALQAADYTTEGILRRYGTGIATSLFQYDTAVMLTATADLGRLSTLIRVLWFGLTVSAEHVDSALRPLELSEAVSAGLLCQDSAGLRAEVQIAPYQDWWLVSDRPLGTEQAMAGAISRAHVGDALDLGCGSGLQSLHLSSHVGQITATDRSPQALSLAATTSALNGFDWELRQGDLAGPVRGRRFDLVVSASLGRLDHGATLAALAPELLTEGGLMQFPATWAHVTGQPWEERVASWFTGTGCDAWVLQTSVADPVSYIDKRPELSAVGTGVISLRYSGRDSPTVHCESLRTGALGPHVRPWFSRADWLRTHRHELLSQRLAACGGLQLRQDATLASPGEWQISRQILALPGGLRWAQEVSPVVAAAISACDGTAPLRDQIAKAAIASDADPAALITSVAALIPQLVLRGFLLPVDA